MEINLLILLIFVRLVDSKVLTARKPDWRKGLLLQVNKVYTKTLHPRETFRFDIGLFESCQQFTMILTTESFDSTRVLFTYRVDRLLQISVDSPQILPTTGPPSLEHQDCKETSRKTILMKVEALQFNYRITVGERTFLRQRRPYDNDLKIFVPQQEPCCLIRAILYEPGDRFGGGMEVVERDHSTVPYQHPTLSTYAPETAGELEHSYSLYSWTRKINERWITTFFVFGIVFFLFLIVFSVFGLTMFICLQKTPKDYVDQSAVAASTINTFRSIVSKSTLGKTNSNQDP